MKAFNENELRDLLICYEVSGPSPQLVDRTRHRMREMMLQPAPVVVTDLVSEERIVGDHHLLRCNACTEQEEQKR